MYAKRNDPFFALKMLAMVGVIKAMMGKGRIESIIFRNVLLGLAVVEVMGD
jgi:hypothetical protein